MVQQLFRIIRHCHFVVGITARSYQYIRDNHLCCQRFVTYKYDSVWLQHLLWRSLN